MLIITKGKQLAAVGTIVLLPPDWYSLLFYWLRLDCIFGCYSTMAGAGNHHGGNRRKHVFRTTWLFEELRKISGRKSPHNSFLFSAVSWRNWWSISPFALAETFSHLWLTSFDSASAISPNFPLFLLLPHHRSFQLRYWFFPQPSRLYLASYGTQKLKITQF